MATVKLKFYQDRAGKHRWQLLASNGNVVLASTQGYTTLQSAGKNVGRVAAMLAALNAIRFEADIPVQGFAYKAAVPGRVRVNG